MKSTTRTFVVLAALATASCFKPPAETCTTDSQCAAGFTCSNGKCVSVTGGGAAGGLAGSGTAGGTVMAGGGDVGGGFVSGGGGEVGGGFVVSGGFSGGSALGGGFSGGSVVVSGGVAGGGVVTAGGAVFGGGGFAGGAVFGGGGFAGGAVFGGGGFAGGAVFGGGGFAGGAVFGGGGFVGGGTALPGDTCANPIPLTIVDAGVFMGSTSTAGRHYSGGNAPCAAADGPDLVYQVSVPAGAKMVATVTPLSRFDIVLNVVADVASCGNPLNMCLDGNDSGDVGQPETVTFSNAGPARTVLLIVDGWQPRDLGNFVLSVSFEGVLAGDTCESPVTLTPGMTLSGQTMTGFNNDFSTMNNRCRYRRDADRVYAVTVPAGQRLTSTVSPMGFDAAISLVAGPSSNCNVPTCETGVDRTSMNGSETLSWDNVSGTSQTVFLIVDSSSRMGGSFSISASLSASPPAAIGGASCSMAVSLDAGTYVSTTLGRSSTYDFFPGNGCLPSSPAADATFAIVVPPNSALTTTVTPDEWDVVINGFLSPMACGTPADGGTLGAMCFASADGANPNSSESISLRNTSMMPTTAYLVVDGAGPSAEGPFSITSEITPLSTIVGDSCAAPQVVNTSGALTGLTTANYQDDVQPSGCFPHSGSGPDRIFSITIPAGQTLTAIAIPNGWDLSLALMVPTQCGMNPMCLGSSESSMTGAESVRYTNSTAMPVEVLVVVDSASARQFGTFDLFTAFTP